MPTCGAILLAGGLSRRMGQDKALLAFGPQALAARLYRVLATVCPEVVVVRDPARGFPVAGARLVADRHPDRGPMEGVATGLEAIASARAVVVACDMPFVTPAVLGRLMAFDPAALALVPRSEHGLEPLLAVYARTLAPELRHALDAGERRLQRLVARLPFKEVPTSALSDVDPTGRAFWNLNHPEAYAEALRMLEGEDPAEPGPR